MALKAPYFRKASQAQTHYKIFECLYFLYSESIKQSESKMSKGLQAQGGFRKCAFNASSKSAESLRN